MTVIPAPPSRKPPEPPPLPEPARYTLETARQIEALRQSVHQWSQEAPTAPPIQTAAELVALARAEIGDWKQGAQDDFRAFHAKWFKKTT